MTRSSSNLTDEFSSLFKIGEIADLINNEKDIEKLLWDICGKVLDIFQCDRTWLLYPCDPEAQFWQVPIERTVLAFPGAGSEECRSAMTPDVAEIFRHALDNDAPTIYGPGGFALKESTKSFGVKSQMSMAIYPRVGKPWQFGVHLCSHDREWQDIEIKLFQIIGVMTGEALGNLLLHRDLQKANEELEQRVVERTVELLEEIKLREVAEKELRKYHDHLEETVSRRTAELEASNLQLREINEDLNREIFHRQQVESELIQSRELLESINKLQSHLIFEGNVQEFFDKLLGTLLALANSEYGFIGEILRNDTDEPYLKTHAFTDIVWANESKNFYKRNAPSGLIFKNLNTLFGEVIQTGRPVISNNPSTDKRRGGIPEGHPPLNSFLGLPFYLGDKFIGMVGLANRPGGYDAEIVQFLQPFLSLCALSIVEQRHRLEKEKAEKKLRTTNEQFEVIFSNTHVGHVFMDRDFNFIRVNKAYADACGYSPDFFTGKNHFELYPHKENQAIFQQVVDTGEPYTIYAKPFEYPDKSEQGTTYWDWSVYPVKNHEGQVTGLIFVIVDVTLAQKNKLELKEHRDHLEELVKERIQFETLIIDISSRFINLPAEEVDENIEQALGEICHFTKTDSGSLFRFSDDQTTFSMTHLWKTDKQLTKKEYLQALDVRTMPWWFDQILNNKNVVVSSTVDMPEEAGLEKNIIEEQGIRSIVNIPLEWENRIQGILGFTSAHRQRQWSEAEITLLNIVGQVFTNALQRQQSVRELLRAKAAAEKSAMAKSEFLANMSHEIRTPMNVIIGMNRLALENNSNPQQQEYLETVQLSSESLLSLIDDILDFSKIEAGQIDLNQAPLNIKKVLNDINRIFSSKAEKKGLELSCRFESVSSNLLLGDEDRLRQILVNLVGNAIKFTESGRITVEAEELHRDNQKVLMQFKVEDTGIGISEEFIEHLFDKFSQENSGVAREFGGTGLGLAITKKLVELHGGDIWVESAPGEGSTFYFTTNFLETDLSSVTKISKTKTKQKILSPIHILLAEDNQFNRFFAKTVLEKQGHKVAEAENGIEVLENLSRGSFDVILMDVQMPKLDGLETTRLIRDCAQHREFPGHKLQKLLERVRKNLPDSRIPIIAMTAHAMADDRRRCIESGMDEYVTKPFNPDEIMTVIGKAIKKEPQTSMSKEKILVEHGKFVE